MRNYISLLRKENTVPVILCGDLNVAPTKLDIHNPYGKNKTPGFSPEERTEFQKMLDCGFVDSFRHLYPNIIKYSYFSNFANARENNKGWRIDMMIVSERDKDIIKKADCLTDYYGSDHVPVLIEIN
jgi:exodeoxyribonuclease-3